MQLKLGMQLKLCPVAINIKDKIFNICLKALADIRKGYTSIGAQLFNKYCKKESNVWTKKRPAYCKCSGGGFLCP